MRLKNQRNFWSHHITEGHGKPTSDSTGKCASFKRCLPCENYELEGGTDSAGQKDAEELKKKKFLHIREEEDFVKQ